MCSLGTGNNEPQGNEINDEINYKCRRFWIKSDKEHAFFLQYPKASELLPVN